MKRLVILLLLLGGLLFSKDYSRREWMPSGWSLQIEWTKKNYPYKKPCNTRDRILIERSIFMDEDGDGINDYPIKFKSNTSCRVVSGLWRDFYSMELITKASKVDIDHVVPLSWAHRHGAAEWPQDLKVAYANYIGTKQYFLWHLVITRAKWNRQKGDKGPDEWLPPANKCRYITHFLGIASMWGLKISTTEFKEYMKLQSDVCTETYIETE